MSIDNEGLISLCAAICQQAVKDYKEPPSACHEEYPDPEQFLRECGLADDELDRTVVNDPVPFQNHRAATIIGEPIRKSQRRGELHA